jgi:hypothetical protein
MAKVLTRLGVAGATVHGFRSAYRDWAGNETNFPREVAEAALAHIVGDKAEQAYRRSDALEKRRAYGRLGRLLRAAGGRRREHHLAAQSGSARAVDEPRTEWAFEVVRRVRAGEDEETALAGVIELFLNAAKPDALVGAIEKGYQIPAVTRRLLVRCSAETRA